MVRTMSNTEQTTNPLKVLTVFHDVEACPLAEQDGFAVMQKLFAALEHQGVKPEGLHREWKMYKQHHTVLPQLEQCVDLGFSVLTVGRKAEAVSSKIRNDITHFVDSHCNGDRKSTVLDSHVAVLIISRSSVYRSQLRELQLAGVRTLVCTRDSDGGAHNAAVQASNAQHLGQWDSVLTNSPKAAVTPRWHIESNLVDKLVGDCGSLSTVIDSAISEAVSADRVLESKGDDCFMEYKRTPGLAAQPSSQPSSPWGPIFGKLDPVLPPSPSDTALFSASGLCRPQLKRTSSLGKIAKGPSANGGWKEVRGIKRASSAPPSPQRTTSVPVTGDSSTDSYRIVTGSLLRVAEDAYRLEPSSGRVVELNHDELDFDYFWMKRLKIAGPQQAVPTAVCCRLHRSGRVTDIRLIGHVDRIVRSQFGFIANPLFPENLYFRMSDLDQASDAPGVSEGAIVAFRVGAKEDRVWAMRVWKVPSSAGVVAVTMPTKRIQRTGSRRFQRPHRGFANTRRGRPISVAE